MKVKLLINKITDYVDKLKHDKHPSNRFRINNYLRIIDQLENRYSADMHITKKSIEQLSLSKSSMEKILALSNGKYLDIINGKTTIVDRKPLSNALIKQLTSIMGIGERRAHELIALGVRNISQLKQKKFERFLPDETKLFLKFKPLDKIPHDDITLVEKKLLSYKIPDAELIFVGSYRRKKPFSSDIDIMYISDKSIDYLLSQLNNHNDLLYPYSKGKDKLSLLLQLKSHVYKLDIFRVKPEDRAPMLLYSTGSKQFNIRMRSLAKRKGYLLNQNGLFEYPSMKKVKLLNKEEDYFKILGIKYVNPEDRI